MLISRSVLTLVSNQPAYFPTLVLARASQPTWSSTVMQSHLLLSLLPNSHLLLTLQVYRERKHCALTSASQSLIKTGTTAACSPSSANALGVIHAPCGLTMKSGTLVVWSTRSVILPSAQCCTPPRPKEGGSDSQGVLGLIIGAMHTIMDESHSCFCDQYTL